MDFADAYRFAVVLRFGLVYGDEPATHWQLDRVRKGKPVVMGDPDGYMSPITVKDAAAAVVASLAAPSGVYNVSGTPLTRAEWAEALGKVCRRRRPRAVPLPVDAAPDRQARRSADPLPAHLLGRLPQRHRLARPHYSCGWPVHGSPLK